MQPETVVGLLQHRARCGGIFAACAFGGAHARGRRGIGGGIARPGSELLGHQRLQLGALFCQSLGERLKHLERPGLAAKAQVRCDACCFQQCSGAVGEPFGWLHSIRDRKLKYKIYTKLQRHFSTSPFTYNGGFSPLEKVPAHDCDDGISLSRFFCFGKVIGMTIMKRIIFYNQTYNIQSQLTF
ncbi:hypothetical protein D3C73_919110 [compost metagenome]